eukprot:544447-Pyramimonas_sp.AAC.1
MIPALFGKGEYAFAVLDRICGRVEVTCPPHGSVAGAGIGACDRAVAERASSPRAVGRRLRLPSGTRDQQLGLSG